MTFSVSARTTGWVAIGVSNDDRMVSYVFCRHTFLAIVHIIVLFWCFASVPFILA